MTPARAMHRRITLAIAMAALLSGTVPARAAENCTASEAVTNYGSRFDPGLDMSKDQPVLKPTSGYSPAEASLAKFKFVLATDAPGSWRLTLYDKSFHVVANLTPEDFRATAGRAQWTGILPGDITAILDGAGDSAVAIRIETVIIYPPQSKDIRYFSTQHAVPAWRDLYHAKDVLARRMGASVGMIYGSADTADGTTVNWVCSGVMVSADTMLTNNHCGAPPGIVAWSDQVRDNMVVDLSRDDRVGVRQQYGVAEILTNSAPLDYALLRLKSVAGGSQFTGVPVYQSLATVAPTVPAAHLFVIHHARGLPKLLTADCDADPGSPGNGASPDELAHKCDTEPGASGAPLFDETGRLVALHHRGFPRDATCKTVGPKLNYAILMSRIIADLQHSSKAIAARLGVPAP